MQPTTLQTLEKAVHLDILGKKVINSNGTTGYVQCVHFDIMGEVSVTVFLGMRPDMPAGHTTTTSISQWKQVETNCSGKSY